MIICGIYRIVLVADGRCYVGQSTNVATRWKSHRTLLRNGTHHAGYMQNAWTKHGEEAFTFEVLEECAVDLLTEREQYWMDHHQPAFNASLVAGRSSWLGRRHTAATISKMRAVHKGKQYALGVVKSAETCAKLSAALTGRVLSAETRAKIGRAHAGKTLTAEHRAAIGAYMKGRAKTPETRARMAAAQRANLRGPAAANAQKTHCKHGHEFTAENTYVHEGSRICRTCGREKMRKLRQGRPKKMRVPKTHCKRGHPLSGDNLYLADDGRRHCRACRAAAAREKRRAA